MNRFLCVIALLLLAFGIVANTVYHYELALPRIEEKSGYSRVSLDGTQTWGEPGEPALPWFGTKILLPLGTEAVEIKITRGNPKTYTLAKPIEALQIQYPFSQTELMPPTLPNSDIYNGEMPFPYQIHNGLNTQFLAGHSINFSAVSPFEYHPLSGELVFYQNFHIEIETRATERAASAMYLLKQDAHTGNLLLRSTDNHAAVPRYESRTTGFEYIIIHDTAKYNQWLPLKDFYTMKGYSVLMKPLQEITAQVTGSDTQDKIRNYIISMYTTNTLRHVLLAGDTDVIPHRGLYVNFAQAGYTDADIPADMYYSCLDGNWNNDGDAYWGEMYEADLAPEISIGRLCYNSDAEIATFINKTMMYQNAPVVANIKSSLFVGEWLWEGPTWGGDYMDEMIGGSSMHGYTTVGVPTSWNISTLYDRTYGYADAWNANHIRPLLSQGANLVNHLGHSNTTYTMRLNNNQATATTITNNGVNNNFSIYFTQGCYSGAFDNRTTAVGQYTTDCITEKFTSIATSAVAMIAHSRYGWGVQGSTNGPSQYLHRQYIDAIFGESIFELGYTLVDSKIDNIPYISNSPVMYWVTYETNLIGDPALMIWTDTPQQLNVQLPSYWTVGVNNYQIQTNAPNAAIRIKAGNAFVYEGFANAAGLININLLQTLNPGNYDLFLNAHNFYGYSTQITVAASQTPYVVPVNITFIDDDNLYHTGEIVNLSITLKNVGMMNQIAAGTLTLNSASPNILVLNGSYNFNPLAAADSIVVNGVFQIRIQGNYTDGAIAVMQFTTSFDGYSTQTAANLNLNAPVLAMGTYQVVGNSNVINPGSAPHVNFTILNNGSGNAYSPMMILFCEDPFVSLSDFELNLPSIGYNSQIAVNAAFTIQVSPNAPLGHTVSISYILGAENGSSVEGNIVFYIGLMSYAFENDMMGWTSAAPNTSFVNQWNRNNNRNFTPNGSYSMKFGGSGASSYANSAYGVLISPDMTLGLNSRLKFHHWMAAEAHSTPTYAWDGGMVQMSLNGGTWQQITPVGGYPHRIYNNPASPFPANTYVWSGSFNWSEVVFDLSAHSGTAKFRFAFGSDGSVTGEGWYIDDVHIESDPVSNDDESIGALRYQLLGNYPNPFNPSTNISFNLPIKSIVNLTIFNLKGQKVKTLVNAELPSGKHDIVWNGKDENSSPVSSGIYLYRINAGSWQDSRKMMLMK
ncbi:MAG: C25 family cysteine peptidase [Candidatus Cloacimonadaceae bacterium]|nr:C25 family cysteine peptidase [Candidatus Cloacimonadaceae bacterium]